MTRHLGYFVAHTIKPLIEELDKVFSKCENLKFDKLYCEYILRQLIELELKKVIIYCVTYTGIALMLLGAVCIILS
jgi:hypothetical protein